jgi:hypothetical protein
MSHTSVLYDGKIYFWGGVDSHYQILNSVDVYDIESDSWSTKVIEALTTVVVIPPTPTITLSASTSTVNYGGSSKLTWSSTNATSCEADWTIKTSINSSETLLDLTSTQDYAISCTGTGGTASTSVTVYVNDLPIPFPPTPEPTATYTKCEGVNLAWTGTTDTDRYQIFRAMSDLVPLFNSGFINSTIKTLYTDSGVINGNTYYYRIKSCNESNGCSDYSSSTSAVVISDCNDITNQIVTSTSTCSATQGGLPTNKVYVNNQMQWEMGEDVPNEANTEWSGTNINSTTTGTPTLNKIYTTVGLKKIFATSTWDSNVATCSATTSVILGGDIIKEI